MSLHDGDAKKMLFVSESEKYGDRYIEHLLEQYKIYIDSSEKISDRRQRSNEFFSGLNTILVGLLGVASSQFSSSNTSALIISASIAGITMCYFWYRIIRAYRGLNGGKFRILSLDRRKITNGNL
jgi:hypothetical protein